MDKSLSVLSKWDNAPGYCGSFPYDAQLPLSPSTFRGVNHWPAGIDFAPNGYGGIVERTDCSSYYAAYRDCAPLQAIINKIAQAHANAVPWVLNTQGKGKGKVSESQQARGIRRLLDRPNMLQTQDEFEAQGKIYQKIFGYNLVFVLRPIGFENWEADEMWNIPASLLDITFKQRNFIGQQDIPIERIVMSYGGFNVNLPLDCCYFQKDFTPSFETVVLPESRIRALSQQITNIQGAYASRGQLIVNRGATGIISGAGKGDDFGSTNTPEDVAEIQRQSRRYGINAGQFRFMITKAQMSYTPIGQSTRELMLFEEIEDDVIALCNGYDYPPRLMGVGKAHALGESDVNGFNKLLYQDNIIPTSRRDAAFWNRVFNCGDYGISIEYDFSHLPVLQEDLKGKGDARDAMITAYAKQWEMGNVSQNEIRIAVGDDPITTDDSGAAFPDGQNPYNYRKPAYDKWMRDNGLSAAPAMNNTQNENQDGSPTVAD